MTRPRRGRQAAVAIPEVWWARLNDEPLTAEEIDSIDNFLFDMSRDDMVALNGEAGPRAVWNEHRDAIVEAWAQAWPGTRPSHWWRWDAPRLQAGQLLGRASGDFGNHLPEPRRRLGGVGHPRFEMLNYWPQLHFGVPVGWVTQSDVDCYGSLSGHFEGLPPDPDNPPMFEAQAAYLQRHGLLLPGEAERLMADDFAPESVYDVMGWTVP